MRGLKSEVQGSGFKVQGSTVQSPAAVDQVSRFLCGGLVLTLLATGCAGSRPLKGGRAVTTHRPAGIIEQTLVQSENPAAATRQDQESVKVRTYTVPAGSRIEASTFHAPDAPDAPRSTLLLRLAPRNHQPSTLNPQPPSSSALPCR